MGMFLSEEKQKIKNMVMVIQMLDFFLLVYLKFYPKYINEDDFCISFSLHLFFLINVVPIFQIRSKKRNK